MHRSVDFAMARTAFFCHLAAMPRPARKPSAKKKFFTVLAAFFCLLVIAMVARYMYAFRDRSPGYNLSLHINGHARTNQSFALKVGFGRVSISPDLEDKSRPVYLAGFSQNRRATGIHDHLWAVATVLDDGQTRLGIIALDAIGFFHDDALEVRRRISGSLEMDYVVLCSTHNHSTPDLLGLWGPDYRESGVDPEYLEQVLTASVKALELAVKEIQPATVAFRHIPLKPEEYQTDTRKPIVYDPDLRVMHFKSRDGMNTLGSIVTWANHPETPWAANTEITADFCGVLRDALENGVRIEDQTLDPGLGGIHLYINGAVGGLMSTTPSVAVTDPYRQQVFKEPSHEKSRAVGLRLASQILPVLRTNASGFNSQIPLSIHAETIHLPMDNRGFLLATFLGLIDRGHVKWKQIRSEIALLRIGDASIACIPGEIYPESVNGGIQNPEGADFKVSPTEKPPIRELMPGHIKFVFGLANDEIGYIIPKSEWDADPPFLYGAEKSPYGEINSLGPDTAPVLHQAFRELTRGLDQGTAQ